MGVVGAASTEAARAMVAMNEVYMLADMRARVGVAVLETKDCLLAGYWDAAGGRCLRWRITLYTYIFVACAATRT